MKHPCKSVTFARSDYQPSASDNNGAPISLALEFIYGYASGGRNPVAARGNVFYNVEGKIVYPAGTFGVVYDPRSHTQRFFTDHDAPISYLVMHPNKRYVATAGVASGIPGSARVPMRPSYVLDENLQLVRVYRRAPTMCVCGSSPTTLTVGTFHEVSSILGSLF